MWQLDPEGRCHVRLRFVPDPALARGTSRVSHLLQTAGGPEPVTATVGTSPSQRRGLVAAWKRAEFARGSPELHLDPVYDAPPHGAFLGRAIVLGPSHRAGRGRMACVTAGWVAREETL